MPFTVQDFRNALINQGARPTQFEVELAFPLIAIPGTASRNATFMAKAATLPPSNLGGITNVFYFGRQVKLPGDRTFPDWTITVLNDESFDVRDAFERWSSRINEHFGNVRNPAAQFERDFEADIIVRQFAKTGGPPIKSYKLVGAWPLTVDTIDLNWDTTDTVEEFGVTLSYQWWESLGPNGPTTDVASIPLLP